MLRVVLMVLSQTQRVMKLTQYLQDGADGASRIILMRLQDWDLNCNVERYSDGDCQGYKLTNDVNTVIFYYNPDTDNIDVIVSFEDEFGNVKEFKYFYDANPDGVEAASFYVLPFLRWN